MTSYEANGFGTPKRNQPPPEDTAIRRIGAVLYGKQGDKLRKAVAQLKTLQSVDSLDGLIELLSGVNTADVKKGFVKPAQERLYAEYSYIVYTVISQNTLVDRDGDRWRFNADLWAKVQQRAMLF